MIQRIVKQISANICIKKTATTMFLTQLKSLLLVWQHFKQHIFKSSNLKLARRFWRTPFNTNSFCCPIDEFVLAKWVFLLSVEPPNQNKWELCWIWTKVTGYVCTKFSSWKSCFRLDCFEQDLLELEIHLVMFWILRYCKIQPEPVMKTANITPFGWEIN